MINIIDNMARRLTAKKSAVFNFYTANHKRKPERTEHHFNRLAEVVSP